MSDYVWRPTDEAIERANVMRLARAHGFGDYAELNRRSREDIEWFWDAVVADLDIAFAHHYQKVLDAPRGIQWPIWFVGGHVNIAQNCVHRHSGPAIVWEGEDGDTRTLTYEELSSEVDRIAAGLRELGVRKGDAVGLFLPMVPEAAIAFMAICHIGGIVVPIFSGFAAQAVAVRLADAEAKVLVCADGFFRRGSVVAMKETADEAVELASCVEYVITVRRTGRSVTMTQPRDVYWDEVL